MPTPIDEELDEHLALLASHLKPSGATLGRVFELNKQLPDDNGFISQVAFETLLALGTARRTEVDPVIWTESGES